jgi:hypothetical protein
MFGYEMTLAGTVNIDTQDTVRGFQSLVVKFSGQTELTLSAAPKWQKCRFRSVD